jgi:hypothetical protein
MRFRRSTAPREEELAALADGSLAAERRDAVDELVGRSPDLEARLEEQQDVVAALHAASASVTAPAGLRARVEAERARRAPARRRRLAWTGGVATAGALAVVAALVLTLPGNVPGGPSVAEAALLATRPATEPAPAPLPGAPKLLARSVDGVPYPDWAAKFGWKAVGARADTVGGRRAVTVFYAKQGRRIGYTIVGGEALRTPSDAAGLVREGTELRVLDVDGRRAVTWLRRGHTCILSGAGVPRATLAKLAAWKGLGGVPF